MYEKGMPGQTFSAGIPGGKKEDPMKPKRKHNVRAAVEAYRTASPLTDPEGTWTGIPKSDTALHIPAMSPEWTKPTTLPTELAPPYVPRDTPVQDEDDL